MWRFRLTILVLLVVGVGILQADPPAEEPADPPVRTDGADEGDSDEAPDLSEDQITERLAELAADIRAAKTPALVDEFYSQASRLDRDDPGVNRAYLERTLQLGQVQRAVYAARRLLKFDPADGQACGVLAYYEAYRGYPLKALPEGIRAAELLPDDPGVMNNAGALTAWYEHQDDVSAISADIRHSVSRNKEAWLEHPDFARAYELVDGLMGVYDEDLDDLEAKLKEIETSKAEAEARIKELAEKIDDIDDDIDDLEASIDELEDDLAREGNAYAVGKIRSRLARFREDLSDLKRDREDWVKEVRGQQRLIDDLQREQHKTERELDRAEDRKRQALGSRDRRFAWELPLVDGERIDLVSARTTGRADDDAPSGSADGVEEQADAEVLKYLQLARQYANAGRDDLAIDMLEKVIILAPETVQAVEAAQLLEALKQPEAVE